AQADRERDQRRTEGRCAVPACRARGASFACTAARVLGPHQRPPAVRWNWTMGLSQYWRREGAGRRLVYCASPQSLEQFRAAILENLWLGAAAACEPCL